MDVGNPISDSAASASHANDGEALSDDGTCSVADEAAQLIAKTPRSALRPVDVTNAAAFAEMNVTARQEYYSCKMIRQVSDERDRLLIEKQKTDEQTKELRSRIDELHGCELSLAVVQVSHRRKRVLEAVAGAAAIFGGALTSAFPAGTQTGFWWFTAPQLFALGWLLLIAAGGWMVVKAVGDF